MLPHFAVADHWHYVCYATVYLSKTRKLSADLLGKFLKKKNAMRHKNGHWNSIWSDKMIKTSVMQLCFSKA